jgi:hypothetical protein
MLNNPLRLIGILEVLKTREISMLELFLAFVSALSVDIKPW